MRAPREPMVSPLSCVATKKSESTFHCLLKECHCQIGKGQARAADPDQAAQQCEVAPTFPPFEREPTHRPYGDG